MIYFVMLNTCDLQYEYMLQSLKYKVVMHAYISFIQSAIDVLANTVENEDILNEEECNDEKGKK